MRLSRREKRLALAALAVAAVVSFKLIVTPLIDRQKSLDEAIEAKARLLERYEGVLQGIDGLETERRGLEKRISGLEGLLLTADTPTLASAELQSILEGLARQKGVKIQSVKTMKPDVAGDYAKILVEITLASEIRPLLEFIYSIENHPKALSIVQINVRPMGRGDKQFLRTVLRVRAGLRNYKKPLPDKEVNRGLDA